jgi:very-short-patch-repair endonuclease
VHWADLAAHEVDPGAPVTSPLRTLVDCARTMPFGVALAIADSALRDGLVGHVQLDRTAEAIRGAGAARARRVLRAADPRAQSGLESALRAIFLGGRISGFVPQLPIRDGAFSARVDLGDRDRKIVAEADSFEHHGHRSALAQDCRRYDELAVRGWLVLRFAWEQVMFDADWVATTTNAAIALRPRRRAKDGGDRSPTNMHKSSVGAVGRR